MRMRTQVRAPPLITRHFGVTTQITGCWRDELESARRAEEEEESEGTKADVERKTGRTDAFLDLQSSAAGEPELGVAFWSLAPPSVHVMSLPGCVFLLPTLRGLLVQEIAPCWTQRDEGRSGHVLPLVSAVLVI